MVNTFLKFSYCIVLLLGFGLSNTYSQITVEFTADKLNGCEVANISLMDLSSSSAGQIVEWDWVIGSLNSSIQDPGFIFNQIGTYTICLTVRDDVGNSGSLCKDDYIEIFPNPVANFSFDQNQSCSPSEVIFTNSGSTNIDSWVWDIGGSTNIINTNDAGEEISTIYESGGSYSVSLIVQDDNGCTDVVTVPNAISVDQSPEILYEIVNPGACVIPVEVNINNLNIESGTTYTWDFGNGENFDGPSPSNIEYTEDGTYILTINAENENCSSTITDTIRIATDPNFEFNYPNEVCQNNVFRIKNDVSNIIIDSVIWTADNGEVFKGDDRTNIEIQNPGCYNFDGVIYIGPCQFNYSLPSCINISAKPNIQIQTSFIDPCSLPAQISLQADILNGTNPNWELIDPNGTVINIPTATDIISLSEIGTYDVTFSFEESSNCIHTYTLDALQIDTLSVNIPILQQGGCVPVSHTLSIEANSLSPIQYEWNIPDLGITSNNPTVLVDLNTVGAHDVFVTITNENGCIKEVELPNYVAAGMSPVTDLSFTPLEVCGDEPFIFTDESSSFANESYWNFSDSIIWFQSFELEHIFSDTGYFDVIHTSAQNGCAGDTVTIENAVFVNGPIAKFDFNIECGGRIATFENTSIGAEEIVWSIQLMGTEIFSSTDNVFDFEFPNPNVYEIFLEATNPSTGCDYSYKEVIVIYDPNPFFEVDTTKGCVPLEIQVDFEVDITIALEAPGAMVNLVAPGQAILTYEESGAFPPPYLLRYIDDMCTDTTFSDSIYVNEVFASFQHEPVFCAPELHEVYNSSISLFGEITSSYWELEQGLQTDNNFDAVFDIQDDSKYDLLLAVSDSWNCVDTFYKQNGLRPILLEVDFEVDTTGCIGQVFEFSNLSQGLDITEASWDFGDGDFSSSFDATHAFMDEGDHEVCLTVTESIGCEKTFCKFIKIENPLAQFSADPTSIDCPPLLVNFTNTSQFSNQYIWDFGDDSGMSTIENPSHIYNEVDLFDVTLIASNNGLCADTFRVVDLIEIFGPRGEWDYEIHSNCSPLEVSFLGLSDGPYEFTWDFGNGEITAPTTGITSDTVNYTFTETGTFIPKLFLDNGAGCIVTIEGDTIIASDLNLNFDVKDSIFCVSPGLIEIQNLSTFSNDSTAFSWTFSNTLVQESSNDENPIFSVDQTGEYQVKLIAETDNCIDSLIVEGVQTIDEIQVNIVGDSICYNEQSILHAEGSAFLYNWYNEQGELINTGDSLSIQLQESMTYTLEGVRESCPNVFDDAFVLVSDPIEVDMETSYTAYSNLSAQAEINYTGNYGFNWIPATGLSCSQCANPSIKPDSSTVYTVIITDLDSGCTIDTTVQIRLINECSQDGIFTPNVFSPFVNGSNNQVQVYAENEDEFISLRIFDRWGSPVFYSENINEAWDGSVNGSKLSSGVYIMKIEAFCTNTQEPFVMYRDITLLH